MCFNFCLILVSFMLKAFFKWLEILSCLLVFENETLKSWLESHCGCVAQLLGFICRVIGRPSVSGCVGHSSGTCRISQRGIFWSSAFQALMCTYVMYVYRSDLVGLGWGLGILTSSQFLLMEEGCTSNRGQGCGGVGSVLAFSVLSGEIDSGSLSGWWSCLFF